MTRNVAEATSEWKRVFETSKEPKPIKGELKSLKGGKLGSIMSAPLGTSFDLASDGEEDAGFKLVTRKKSRKHRALVAKKKVEENTALSEQLGELALFWGKDVVLSRGKHNKLCKDTIDRTVDHLTILLGYLEDHLGTDVDLWTLAEPKNLEDVINFLCTQKNKNGSTLSSGTVMNYCESARRLLIFLHAQSVASRSEGQPERNIGMSVNQLEELVHRIKLVRNTVAKNYENQRKNSDTKEEMHKRGGSFLIALKKNAGKFLEWNQIMEDFIKHDQDVTKKVSSEAASGSFTISTAIDLRDNIIKSLYVQIPPGRGKEMYTMKHSTELDAKKRGPGNWIVQNAGSRSYYILYLDNHKTSKHYGEATIALDHDGMVALNAKIMVDVLLHSLTL